MVNSVLTGGQSLEDKLYALKYFISGQALSFVVLKATTSEPIGPKRKHLTYLVGLTHEANVSVPELVRRLMLRAKHQEWPVAFKALITIQQLMSLGNERFTQALASSSADQHQLDHLGAQFMDPSSAMAQNMSVFVRRFARYLAARLASYRALGLDLCAKPGWSAPREPVHEESLLAWLAQLQDQIDALAAFDAQLADLSNAVISCAFAALHKDFQQLYLAYQGAALSLLRLYLCQRQIGPANRLLSAYRCFLVRMEKVRELVDTLERLGLWRASELPAPISQSDVFQLSKLEQHTRLLQLQQLSPGLRRRVTGSSLSLEKLALSPVGRRSGHQRQLTAQMGSNQWAGGLMRQDEKDEEK